MYYKTGAERIKTILSDESIHLDNRFLFVLLDIMSEMCNYTEEDHRIRPQVILGEELESFFVTINPHDYFIVYSDSAKGDQLPRIFKSLALFCNNGWYIVINHKDDGIEYGLFRRYTEINGERFEDYFKENLDDSIGTKMIIIRTNNSCEISISRASVADEIISQRYIERTDPIDTEFVYREMATVITSGRSDYNPKFVQDSLVKMFRNFPQKVHGTIVIIIEDSYELPDNILAGIKLSPSIDYYESFLAHENIESYAEAESVYALTGLLYEMLNTDGITVITNRGRVIYYNVFYKGDIPQNIKGGARKRTAKGILNNAGLEGVIGVYFQSQDGDIFFERKQAYE